MEYGRDRRKGITALHSEIMESTGDFHHEIRKAFFGVAKDILNNTTTFDSCNDILN
jgi:hypothetical protein